ILISGPAVHHDSDAGRVSEGSVTSCSRPSATTCSVIRRDMTLSRMACSRNPNGCRLGVQVPDLLRNIFELLLRHTLMHWQLQHVGSKIARGRAESSVFHRIVPEFDRLDAAFA